MKVVMLFAAVLVAAQNNTSIQKNTHTVLPFPLADFLRFTFLHTKWNLTYMEKYRCERNDSLCTCHAECVKTGDCCLDFMWNVTNTSAVESHTIRRTMLDHINKLMEASPHYECQKVLPALNVFGYSEHFLLVTKCPNKTGQTCLQTSTEGSNIPVLGNDSHVYMNLDCAKCNNVASYKPLNFTATCNIAVRPWERKKISSVCSMMVKMIKKEGKGRFKKCLGCNDKKATFCQMFKAPVSNSFSKYDNVFCADCNELGFANKDITTSTKLHLPEWSKTVSVNVVSVTVTSIKAIDYGVYDPPCPAGQELDFSGACIKAEKICGHGQISTSTGCAFKLHTYARIGKIVETTTRDCFTVSPVTVKVYMNKEQNVSDVPNEIERIQENLNLSNARKWESLLLDNKTVLWKMNNVFVGNLMLDENSLSQNVKKLSIYTSREVVNTTFHGQDHTRTFEGESLCAAISRVPRSEVVFLNDSCQQISMQNRSILFNTSQVNFEIDFENGRWRESVYYCQKFYLRSSCYRQNINPTNYTIDGNYSLIFVASGEKYIFTADQYVPTLNGFQICRKTRKETNFEQITWYMRMIDVKEYISLVGTCCSLLAYVIMFILFCIIKSLRNTGGYQVFVLVILLFIADITFLFTDRTISSRDVCKWVGLSCHFLLVLVSEWTVVIVFDILMRFLKATQHRSASFRYILHKLFYCIVGNCILFAIVICLNQTGTVEFNYENACWIGSFYPLLIFYLAPVTVVYIVCIVSLSLIVHAIRKHQKQSTKLLKGSTDQTSANIYKIALKLLVILGVSECFGLIQIPTLKPTTTELVINIIFSTFYDVIRSLRGVLICIVYFGNKKTLHLLRARRRDHTRMARSSNVTTEIIQTSQM